MATIDLGIRTLLKSESRINRLHKLKLGLLTNPSGVNEKLQMTADILAADSRFALECLFSPEHGIRGENFAGEVVTHGTDSVTGLPVYSLYEQRPSDEIFSNLDIVLVDLQDIGSRYYTFFATVLQLAEQAIPAGCSLWILDRPNPLGGLQMQGPLVEQGYRSIVSAYPAPIRHGMTIGELSLMFLSGRCPEDFLDVVPMSDWHRDMLWNDTDLVWVPPTLNSSSVIMANLYSGTCIFEGINVSEGRGTALPFQVVGAPWIEGCRLKEAAEKHFSSRCGIVLRPVRFVPTTGEYSGEVCEGVQFHLINRKQAKPLTTAVGVVMAIHKTWGNMFAWSTDQQGDLIFDRLLGTDVIRQMIEQDESCRQIEEYWERQCFEFRNERREYLIY